ncbi:MAG: ankyrin repeat domain-containing protein [Bacteroidales bacterium]|nr:ankyrin repeat domain-containing protein [Bacteroidales bacterium]
MQINLKFYKLLTAFMLFALTGFSQEFPLIKAVQDNNAEDVKHYLNRNTDVNAFDSNGYTALMYAVDNLNIPIIKMLMEAGANADLNPLYDNEPPALHTAVLKNSPKVADLLLLYSQTDVNFLDGNEQTALYQAVKFGYLECAEVLLFHGANPDRASENSTPLQIAAYYGDTAAVTLLLKNKADVNKICQEHTALSVALSRGNLEAAKILAEAGADKNLCNPGVYVAAYSDAQTLEYIKNLGIDLNKAEEKYGYSLKDVSVFTENSSTKKELKKLGVKSNKPLILRRFSLSEINEFSKHEARMGFQAGLHESNTKTAFYVGVSFRPSYMCRLKKISDNYYYQLREKLTFLHIGLEKLFPFYNTDKADFGAYLGYQFSYCSGKYDGSVEFKPENESFHSPSVGLYSRLKFIGLSVGYKYYGYQNSIQAPKNVFRFGIDFYFSRRLKGYGSFEF